MEIVAILFIVILSVIVLLIAKRLFMKETIPSLKNRHVMITGGSSGIGLAVAVKCAELGAHVTIIARDHAKLETAKAEILKSAQELSQQKIACISLDVTENLDVISKALTDSEKEAGPVYLLVNCAGMAICGKLEDASEKDLRHMMNLNYFGSVLPTKVIGAAMKQRKEGYIVVTGSQGSLLGIFGMSGYCGTKYALKGFAEAIHMEMAPHNVSVTLCLPPDTNTPGFDNENKSKPVETQLISEAAGLAEPAEVAHQLLVDAMNRRFMSTVGFEGFILTTLCAGMGPLSSVSQVFLEVTLMSLLRLVSVGYLISFARIIKGQVDKQQGGDKKEN